MVPWRFSDVQVHVYGDVAVMTGRATGTLQNGTPAGASLRFTRVHVKRETEVLELMAEGRTIVTMTPTAWVTWDYNKGD